MIEENENIDLVTMRRQQEMQRAQEDYRNAVSEGRLAVRPRQGEVPDGSAALVAADNGVAGGSAAFVAADNGGVGGRAALVAAEPEAMPADPEAAWRYTRLAITAGLVVLLFVVWIWQRKRSEG